MRRVKAGETITVTDHGKTIGQIVPVKTTVEERLQTMVSSGQAEWNGRRVNPIKQRPSIEGIDNSRTWSWKFGNDCLNVNRYSAFAKKCPRQCYNFLSGSFGAVSGPHRYRW